MTSDELRAGGEVDASPPAWGIALQVTGVSKRYGNVQALKNVNLTVRSGTVHGFVGENGSGKSTLTKVIAGVVQPDEGHVAISGNDLMHASPRESIQHGVRVIYQDLALFPNMTVAENLAFEGDAGLLSLVRSKQRQQEIAKTLRDLGLNIDPATRLGDLSSAERQLVAIARSVSSQGELIIMDEPTAALTLSEIDTLLATVRRLSEQGIAFIFISHKLREVVDISDDVTVIRDGEIVSSGPSEEYDQDRITTLMTGGLVENLRRTVDLRPDDTPIISARNLTLGHRLKDVSFDLYPGRITGLAGLVGSGRTEVGLALAGLIAVDRGRFYHNGKPLRNLRGNKLIQYVPEDRLTEGLYLDWSIADNIIINNLDEALVNYRMTSNRKVQSVGQKWVEQLRIKATSAAQQVLALSGGNQQRVLLSRALAPQPEVVILNNPTVGVDVASRADIHNVIRDVADAGTSVLMISDEPAELLTVADDLIYIVDGQIIEGEDPETLTENELVDAISKGLS